MLQTDHTGLRTWIEIDTQALDHNFKTFKKLVGPDVKVCPVVKSNAYGHGLVGCSQFLEKAGADFLAVDSITEGIRLRKDGIKIPILVLGFTMQERYADAVEHDISLTIAGTDQLQAVIDFGSKQGTVKIHLKADTGLHRQGFVLEEKEKVIELLKQAGGAVEVEGLYTHFAMAKNPAFPGYAKRQMNEFGEWKEIIRAAGFSPICHMAATDGTTLYDDSHNNMVRIGIGSYGYWPSDHIAGYARDRMEFKPVMTWKTIVAQVKHVQKGETVGYDCTEKLRRDSVLAVLPIGYWHGFPRALSSVGHVIVGSGYAKVVGRVSMDMVIVDITDCGEVKAGDEVILIGKKGDLQIASEEIARLADTINYEIVTRINPLIRRIFV